MKEESTLNNRSLSTEQSEMIERCSTKQRAIELLYRCVKIGDMNEWNLWRQSNPEIEIKLEGIDLYGANLRNVDFHNTDLRFASLESCDLSFANLEGANLSPSNLNSATLIETNFTNANLSEADFRDTDLSKSILWEAKLISTNLRGANLSFTDLTGSDLRFTNLKKVTFNQTKLDDAIITGAQIDDINVNEWQIQGIKCDYLYEENCSKDEQSDAKRTTFQEGEFEKRFEELPSFECYFPDASYIEIPLLEIITEEIKTRFPKYELEIKTITKEFGIRIVFTVNEEYADTAKMLIEKLRAKKLELLENTYEDFKVLKTDYHPNMKIFKKTLRFILGK